jgi:general secretion pathway protein G
MKRLPLRPTPPRRAGFTLIELLAVIVILAILVALLVPAVMNARKSALAASVSSEIGTISGAITSFKQDFGIEPPSYIVLSETGGGWSTASIALLGRMWPQFNFALSHDFNLDGDTSDTLTLYGSECLVFFLGGPTSWTDADSDGVYDSGEIIVPTAGFSRNPANPFAPLPASGASNRQGPFFNFLVDRLIASPTNTNFYGYNDPLSGTSAVYLYVSSYDGQGYNAADLGGAMTDAYRNGTSTTSPYYNPNSFQIISAGFDRAYGTGGPYQNGIDMGVARDPERDNITNFSKGMLAP